MYDTYLELFCDGAIAMRITYMFRHSEKPSLNNGGQVRANVYQVVQVIQKETKTGSGLAIFVPGSWFSGVDFGNHVLRPISSGSRKYFDSWCISVYQS